jgi:hypothetical protein
MPPFNNDFPNSLLLAQDPVALESVCYDFFLEEYKDKPSNIKYPYYNGAGDYILQAADPANWPDGIEYDPENDGSVIGSLGVAEHWNNGIDKQYSVNLGLEKGIELVSVPDSLVKNAEPSVVETLRELNASLSPNPSRGEVRLSLNLEYGSDINVMIFNSAGQLVFTLQKPDLAPGYQSILLRHRLSPGVYIVNVAGISSSSRYVQKLKLIVTD